MGAKRDLKTMCCRFLLVSAYCVLGAAIFYAIEHEDGYADEVQRKNTLYNQTKSDIMQRFGINDTEFELLVSKIQDAKSHTSYDWSFSRGIDLSWQSMTTIGYGNKTPTTVGGQLFLIPFALFGIPLFAFMLKTIAENISHFICYIITKIEKNVLKREDVEHLHLKSLVVTCCFTIGLILFMAAISTIADNWSFPRGMYVWFVTFTTIGFGDFIPGDAADDKSGIAVVSYRLIFVIIGLSLLATILNGIGDFVESRRKPAALKSCAACCTLSCWSKTESGEVNELEVKNDNSYGDKNGSEQLESKSGVRIGNSTV